MSNNEAYVKERRKQAERLSFLFKIMRFFRIQKNKIVFSSFEGDGGFCCNPRYIAEELHIKNDNLKMIWLTHDSSKRFPDYIKVVKDSNILTAYHLSTAKIWVDNYRKPYGTLKRNGQYYVQTWHATFGFKAVGLFRGKAFPEIARLVSEWDSALIDYTLSNSDYCDRIYPKKLLYNGKMFRSGTPRCDCIIGKKEELRKQIRSLYGLNSKEYLVLYAPTFRSGNQSGKKQVISNDITIDFELIRDSLVQKFGGSWTFFLRLHPQLSAKMDKMPIRAEYKCMVDVSQEDDVSELIAASDMLITDYSSCAFDAAFCGVPVLLYADDIDEYRENRGELMWKKDELPFSVAETNDELAHNIASFDKEDYLSKVKDFMQHHGVVEDGHASERVADLIEGLINKE